MKISTIVFYLALIFGIISCVNNAQKEKNVALSLIDNYLQKGATIEEIEKILGRADRIMKLKGIQEKIYDYNNKINALLEWSFGADEMGRIVWINHKPWSNPLLDRIEILPETFKKYNCKKKTEPNKKVPHVIQEYTFFECAKGKIRAYYNIHGEISTIAVNR